MAARGDGPYVLDTTGKRYLDASGGAAVSCLGHSNAAVNDAIKAQLDRIAFAHTGFFTNEPMEKLADFLCERAPGDLNAVYFVSGGSEAVEAALKLARQYFIEKGEGSRSRFISRRQSYHGNTLGALSAGGNEWRREPYSPLLMPVALLSPCYAYREKRDGESDFDFGQRVANELEEEILRQGPETICAFICEPVVGATLGAVPAVEGYFSRIREICDTYGILLILDEVMCGMGRTGTLFACEQEGVAPDILVTAKGLGAGYQPIGAMLVSDRIYQTIRNGSGFFQHGHTYMGHPVACAASLAVQTYVEDNNLLENVRLQGAALKNALEATFGQHPFIGDIRGRGLFLGLEIVEDKETKAPFDPARKINAKVKAAAMDAGLMCYPMGGTIDGQRGDHVLLAPPFIIEASHVDEIVSKLAQAFQSTFKEV
ncbi:adenosylmethionine-8-amino-7-oxononanoate aminotransferase [Sneathiella chinensis]|uniref:Adenosylmethionine-8-amino-7-oxononanoate aminotransferase n=2 Tax=Sneathiella chinensis TaxID=349750 RepID=A0ABQ5U290_9PROT|nr:adenosylmethionine-8-amino-7-oxononanoate aminotransferase [Sneathiella chinensis]